MGWGEKDMILNDITIRKFILKMWKKWIINLQGSYLNNFTTNISFFSDDLFLLDCLLKWNWIYYKKLQLEIWYTLEYKKYNNYLSIYDMARSSAGLQGSKGGYPKTQKGPTWLMSYNSKLLSTMTATAAKRFWWLQ